MPRPGPRRVAVGTRLLQEEVDGLDAWAQAHGGVTRGEALRLITQRALSRWPGRPKKTTKEKP